MAMKININNNDDDDDNNTTITNNKIRPRRQ